MINTPYINNEDMIKKFEQEKIIRDTLAEIPVGYIPNHTHDNLPELVKYHVQRSCALGILAEEGSEILKYGHTPLLYAFIEKIIKTDQEEAWGGGSDD